MKIIGWKEMVDLPGVGLNNIPAKVDTGARTSVLHCSHIQLLKRERYQYIEFHALDERFGGAVPCLKPLHSQRVVKNSFGQVENRYMIHTTIFLFDQLYNIELSLRDRSNMAFPLLLGRSFIRKRFVVDVSKAFLAKDHFIENLS